MFQKKREVFCLAQIIFWKEHPHYCAVQTLYFQMKILSDYVWVRFRARACEKCGGTKCYCYTLFLIALQSLLVNVILVMLDIHISFPFDQSYIILAKVSIVK